MADRMFSRRAVLKTAVLGGLAAALPRLAWANGEPIVETAAGKLRGVEVEGIRVFKGVPYGASPAGAARFKAPRPATPWTGIRDALAYGPQQYAAHEIAPM